MVIIHRSGLLRFAEAAEDAELTCASSSSSPIREASRRAAQPHKMWGDGNGPNISLHVTPCGTEVPGGESRPRARNGRECGWATAHPKIQSQLFDIAIVPFEGSNRSEPIKIQSNIMFFF
jgi:hypothetical protein